MKTLSEQLAAAQREEALRRNVYPKWISSGRLTQAKADHEIDCMAAIVATLQKMKDLEEVSEEIKALSTNDHLNFSPLHSTSLHGTPHPMTTGPEHDSKRLN